MKNLPPEENKFHKGNGQDKKHYWLTPPDLMAEMDAEFKFDTDVCPYPFEPNKFDGLVHDWGQSNYANTPFGATMHNGKKKGQTAWVRKAIAEFNKGKRVVMVYPIDKWVLMLVEAGAEIRNLGDVKWCATEDGTPGKGTGRHIAQFILDPFPKINPEQSELNLRTAEMIADRIMNSDSEITSDYDKLATKIHEWLNEVNK